MPVKRLAVVGQIEFKIGFVGGGCQSGDWRSQGSAASALSGLHGFEANVLKLSHYPVGNPLSFSGLWM
jgi:hypothetical protein